jgi:hypothetical protein
MHDLHVFLMWRNQAAWPRRRRSCASGNPRYRIGARRVSGPRRCEAARHRGHSVRPLTAEISIPLWSERTATTVVPFRPVVSREAPRKPRPQSEPPFIEQARRKARFNRRRPFVFGRVDSPVTWPGRAGRDVHQPRAMGAIGAQATDSKRRLTRSSARGGQNAERKQELEWTAGVFGREPSWNGGGKIDRKTAGELK